MNRQPSSGLPAAYWRLWTASAISNLGDGVAVVALPLLAARLTRDPRAVSLIDAAEMAPWLILSLPIGALVDRHDRRNTLVRADTVRFVVVAVVATLIAADHAKIWMLWILALVLGTCEVFFDNASQAILPAIVEPEQLPKANGRRYSIEMIMNQFLGAPVGSVLIGVAVWVPFGLNAASFAAAAVLAATLPGSFRASEPPATQRPSLTSEIREGLSWLWNHRLLRSMAVALGLSNIGFQMSNAVFVLYAQNLLHASDIWFGLIISIMAVGAVLGGLLGDRIARHLGTTTAMYSAIGTWVVTQLLPGLFTVTWVVAVSAAFGAMAATVWNVITVSLRQQIVPPHLFGRVNSVYRWFGWGTLPIGAVLGGQVAHAFGLRAPYIGGAIVISLALMLVLTSVTPARIQAAMQSPVSA